MKIIKTLLLFAFISIIAVSCKEQKKEEVGSEVEAVDDGYGSSSDSEATDATSDSSNDADDAVDASAVTATEAEQKAKDPATAVEASAAGVEEMKIEEEGVIVEATAHTPVVFPGCDGGTAEEIRACSIKKYKAFFHDNFNSEVVNEIEDLKSGIHKMTALLKIDEAGKVSVSRVRAEKNRLDKEFRRVIALSPVMKPATKDGKAVSVAFILPVEIKIAN